MRECLGEQAAKELSADFNTALRVLAEVQDTPKLEGKKKKADEGEKY